MNEKKAISAIKGAITAIILLSIMLTICLLGIILFSIKKALPLNLSIILISAIVSYLVAIICCAIGIYKKSYTSSIILMLLGTISFICVLISKGTSIGILTIIIWGVILSCFYQGVRGTRYFKNKK